MEMESPLESVPVQADQEDSGAFRLPFYYGWVLMVVLGVTSIISYGTTQYLIGVLVVPLDENFQWGRTSISAVHSLALVIAGLLGVPVGSLVDMRGARVLMSVGSALAGLCLLGLWRMNSLWQFYLLWAGGQGIAMALTHYPVAFTVVANWFVKKRSSALAVLTLIGGLSAPICIPLAGSLVAGAGWRSSFFLFGLTQLAIALPLHAFLLRRHPEDIGLSRDGESAPVVPAVGVSMPGSTLSEALRSPVFWMLTAALALVTLSSSTLFVHQVAFMISRGADAMLAAGISGLLGLSSLPGRFTFNLLSARISPQSLLSLSVAVQAAALVVLVQAPSSVGWLVLYAVIYGSAYGAFSPLRASVMADHFERRAYGVITAVQGIPLALCGGLGPLVAGWLYDRMQQQYQLSLWLCVGVFTLAALGIAVTPRPIRAADVSEDAGKLVVAINDQSDDAELRRANASSRTAFLRPGAS